MNRFRATLLASTVCAFSGAACAQTSIPVSQLANQVAAQIKQLAYAGIHLDSALAGSMTLLAIQQTAAAALPASKAGAANGVATLGATGTVPASQLLFGSTTGTVADGGLLTQVSGVASGALPATQLSTSPFVATGTVAVRDLADRATDRLNEVDFVQAGDADDTLAVQRLYTMAQFRMALGQDPILDFPRKITVSTMPQLQMPVGRSPMFMSAPKGGTEIVMTGAGNAIDIQATYTGSAVLSSPGVGDFKVTKAPGAKIGYDAVRIAGLPNSVSPGAVYNAHVGSINCRGSGFGGSTPNPWAACVEIVDQNYSWIEAVNYAYTGPANGEPKSGIGVLYTTTLSSTAGNFSVDHYIGNVTMNAGFAGVATSGHVEGVRLLSGAIVGANYGVRCPAWQLPGTPVTYGGCDGLYVSQTHMNVVTRGVYAEASANVQVDASDYIVSPNNGAASAIATDAVLPLDTAVLNPANNLNGYTWVGVDCISCAYSQVIGTSIYGTGAGYGNGVRFTTLPINGATIGNAGVGNKVEGAQIFAVNGYAIHTDPGVTANQVDGNNAIGTSGYDLGAGTEHSSNQSSGVVWDTGFLNGQYVVQGDVAPSGKGLFSYGYVQVGGVNRAVIDLRGAGYTGTGLTGNARIELSPAAQGSPTGQNDAQVNFSAAAFNFSANLTAAGFTATALSNFQAEVDLSFGLLRVGGTNRGLLDLRGANYTGTAQNVRIELAPNAQGSATGVDDGQLNLSAAAFLFNSSLTALGEIIDQSGKGYAVSQPSALVITMGNTQRTAMLQGGVGSTITNGVTVQLPTNPVDQQCIDIVGDVNVSTFSLVALANSSGTTPVIAGAAPTSFSLSSPLHLIFNAANQVWEPR